MMKQPSSATGMQIRRTSLKPGETARAYTGEQSIIQPQILPLHEGTSAIEVLASINDGERREGYEVVRETWKSDNSDNLDRKSTRLNCSHEAISYSDFCLIENRENNDLLTS